MRFSKKSFHLTYLRYLVRLKHFITKPRMRPFVYFLTSSFTYIALAIVLIYPLLKLFKGATKQYSPVVNRVAIRQDSGGSYGMVKVECTLYSDILKDNYNASNFFFAHLVPQSDQKYLNRADSSDIYQTYTSITFSSSGRDAKPSEYSEDELWEYENFGEIRTKKRIVREKTSDNKGEKTSVYKVESYSTRGYPSMALSLSGNEVFLPQEKNNPYIAFHLEIKGVKMGENTDMSWIDLHYNHDFNQQDDYLHPYEHPLNIINIFPRPTKVTPSSIVYMGEDLKKALSSEGVYIIAEDITKKKLADRISFLCSFLLGVVVSLYIQLITTIILRWKKAFPPIRKM